MSMTDLRNLCCLSKQNYADASRTIFATAHLPLDGIWSHESLRKGRLWLFLESIGEKVDRKVWEDDIVKEIVIYDKKIPPKSTIRKKLYTRVITMLLHVMESLTSLRVFRYDGSSLFYICIHFTDGNP